MPGGEDFPRISPGFPRDFPREAAPRTPPLSRGPSPCPPIPRVRSAALSSTVRHLSEALGGGLPLTKGCEPVWRTGGSGCRCPLARWCPGGCGWAPTQPRRPAAPSTARRDPGAFLWEIRINPWKAGEKEGGKGSRLGRVQNPCWRGRARLWKQGTVSCQGDNWKNIAASQRLYSFFFFFTWYSKSSRKLSTAKVVRVSIPRPESH